MNLIRLAICQATGTQHENMLLGAIRTILELLKRIHKMFVESDCNVPDIIRWLLETKKLI